jgi:hypothetical protein
MVQLIKNQIDSPKFVLSFWVLSAVINLLLFLWVFLTIQSLNAKVIPLHYNIVVGVDYLDEPKKLFVYPVSSCLIFFVNIVLARFLRKESDFFSFLCSFASFLVSLIVSLSLMFLLIIV